jgi:multidrug resistance protein, MATE family
MSTKTTNGVQVVVDTTSTVAAAVTSNTTTSNSDESKIGTERQPLVIKSSSTLLSSSTSASSSFSSTGKKNDGSETDSIWVDAKDTIVLGIPIFLTMLSWVGMKTTDTSLLGHVSVDALAASALSDLWTMCTQVLLQGRVLGIICGSAIGAGNPKLAGIYLQVSYYVLIWIVGFVFVAWYCTEYIWLLFGSNEHLASMAGYYARVLALSLPGQMIYGQLSQFFSSQRIMHPEVNAASVALLCNLLFGLLFVLGIPFPSLRFGFVACPIVTSCMVYIQLFVVVYFYMYKQQLHKPCWDGWAPKEITWERIKTFIDLYIPAALGSASDFWRVAAVGTVAAKLGGTEVSVFNTSYRIMWIVMIVVSSISSSAAIKMTLRLGNNNPKGAKQAGEIGIILSTIILLIVAVLVVIKIRWFGRIFSNDKIFLDTFETVRVPFTITLVLMNLSVSLERIPYSMGRTKEVFWFGLVASWVAQVPAVIILTTYWHNDLIGLYYGMAIGYLVLAILYSYIVITSDWDKYAIIARRRSEIKSSLVNTDVSDV